MRLAQMDLDKLIEENTPVEEGEEYSGEYDNDVEENESSREQVTTEDALLSPNTQLRVMRKRYQEDGMEQINEESIESDHLTSSLI